MGGRKRSKRPTSRDVAQLAGVSQATVSYVLTNKEGISIRPETRERVLKAAQELGYVVDASARALVNGQTRMLGFLMPEMTNPFYIIMVQAVNRTAVAAGYNLLIGDAEDGPEMTRSLVGLLLERRVDGVLIDVEYRKDLHDSLILLEKFEVPMVKLYATGLAADKGWVVSVDEFKVGEMATEYLIRLGHRRIGFFPSPSEPDRPGSRYAGYRLALSQAGVDPRELPSDLSEIIAGPHRCTAIVAGNEMCATQVIRSARELGIRVPEDLSIVCGGDTYLATLSYPALTTVDRRIEYWGETAARLLVDVIEGRQKESKRVIFGPKLVVRDSAQPPRR